MVGNHFVDACSWQLHVCVWYATGGRPPTVARHCPRRECLSLVHVCYLNSQFMQARMSQLYKINRWLNHPPFLDLGKVASHLAGQEMQGVRPCFNDLVLYMIRYAASRRDCMSSNMSQGICCPWCLCCLLGSGHGSGNGKGIGLVVVLVAQSS